MKLIFTAVLLILSLTAFCQESFRKSFRIEKVIHLEGGEVIKLQKFDPSSDGSTVSSDSLKITEGYVMFDEDKVWVNPNLSGDFEDQGLYYYQLSNRQSIKLQFDEWTVSAFTIPIKYRFKDKSSQISEEFTSGVNANVFAGKAWGRARFHHRKKVGNITNVSKFVFGVLLGTSTVTLDKNNTSAANDPITDDTKITKGLASAGLGLGGSFNKINVGFFYGYDIAIGQYASKWNYNKKPWLGLAVGYSILSF